MTVKELKEILNQYDDSSTVCCMVPNEEGGCEFKDIHNENFDQTSDGVCIDLT